MKSRASIPFLLVVLALALCGLWLAGKVRQQRHATEREIAGHRAQRSQLRIELEQAEKKLAAVEVERQRVAGALEAARRSASAVTPPRLARVGDASRAALAEATAQNEALRADPEAQRRRLAQERERLIESLRPLGAQLGLTPPQFEQLIETVLKRYEERMDVSFALEKESAAMPKDAHDALTAKLFKGTDARFRAAQTALLGEDGYRVFDVYQRTTALRRLVDGLAGTTAVAGAGLTGPQADALLDALANASPAFRQGGTAVEQEIDWDRALEEARRALPEAQFAVAKTVLIQRRNLQRLQELARK